jgi:HK97 family phage portal protein
MGMVKNWLEKRFLEMASGWSALGSWVYSGPPAAGENVSESNAMTLSTVFACVRIISETVASLPLHVYKRDENGSKSKAVKHPLYYVLHDEASDEMTSMSFWESILGHALTWGNGYAEIVRDGRGVIVEFKLLDPSSTYPTKTLQGDKLVYYAVTPEGKAVTLPPEKVLHIHGLSFDGLKGYSPIQMMRESLSATMATEKYGARFFANGGKPSGVLEMDATLKDENAANRLRDQWRGLYNAENQHQVAVLENGLKYKPISLPPEDAQFLETRKWQKEEIAQMFSVPMHMLQNLERATFSNIEHQAIMFVVHTIRPWLVRIEQEIRRKCFKKGERGVYYAEFLVDGLLRGDSKSRAESLEIQRRNGVINANDWREVENMNPIEGDAGTKYMVNGAMIDASKVAGLPNQANPTPEGGEKDNGDGKTSATTG